MRFDDLLAMVRKQPYFDLATVIQLSGEDRGKVRTQLSRWMRRGNLIPLRRGMYTLAEHYRAAAVNPAELANHLYTPSYLSREWALGFYDLIPERVVMWTSVTTRVPRRFENEFGWFDYRNVKQAAFFGYRVVEIQTRKVMLAAPEKALLDLWRLSKGPWTDDRIAEMRFQNQEMMDHGKLKEYALRYQSPRLLRGVDMWRRVARSTEKGAGEL